MTTLEEIEREMRSAAAAQGSATRAPVDEQDLIRWADALRMRAMALNAMVSFMRKRNDIVRDEECTEIERREAVNAMILARSLQAAAENELAEERKAKAEVARELGAWMRAAANSPTASVRVQVEALVLLLGALGEP